MSADFSFRQFDISQSNASMKVGTDGVLLGAWACDGFTPARVADIGTGTGLIALMCAQRFPDARITAIDIHTPSLEDAARNIAASPWHDRIDIIDENFVRWVPDRKFDLIISNPPFFTEALRSPDTARAASRHAGDLSPVSLIERAPDLLTPSGCIAFIAPVALDDEVEWTSTLHKMHPVRHTRVLSKVGKAPLRSLWELSLSPAAIKTDTLAIRGKDGSYTREYLRLTCDFYLHLTQ